MQPELEKGVVPPAAMTERSLIQEKARQAEDKLQAFTTRVSLDLKTYGKIVDFISEEGCSLQEGLRRAVRIGVEALLLEQTPKDSPVNIGYDGRGIQVGYTPWHNRTVLTEVHGELRREDPTPPIVNDDSVDYARTAPPGL